MIGASSSSADRIVPGMSRLKLRSPGPHRFPHRVTATGVPVRMEVRQRDEIGARLRDVVRKPPLQRRLLRVRQAIVDPVRLVARGDDDAPDEPRVEAAGLQQIPGTADVRFERGQRRARGRADDRLRAEVEDRVDLVLVERAGQQRRGRSDRR